MNFFELQARARRSTRRLVVLFALAVIGIVLAVQAVLLLTLTGLEPQAGMAPFSAASLRAHSGMLLAVALATIGIIGLASLYRTASLRTGGGRVAAELGGVRVDPDTRDPRLRRLVNVVEEIALASGVPVPEIYLLEHESGINAFAAGFTPSDAAVAVTRGAVERLDRNELQGVIAHEFSHILNGDMRLNIRLMGVLFGILMLSLIARRVLRGSIYVGRSRNSSGGVVVAVAVAVMVVGTIGLFFGRWIKSAVSRQREYLADAAAVQFTRLPEGLAGALKKIAALGDGAHLKAETEEVSHMLFGAGQPARLFATHPPVLQRIRRIEPRFDEGELKSLRWKMQQEAQDAADEARPEPGPKPPAPDPAGLVGRIARVGDDNLWQALLVAGAIPRQLNLAAHSADRFLGVLFHSVLSARPETAEQQLTVIEHRMGIELARYVRRQLRRRAAIDLEQKLPLLEMMLPRLRQLSLDRLEPVDAALREVAALDGEVDLYEFLLTRLVSRQIAEFVSPHRARTHGNRRLGSVRDEADLVLVMMARHGDEDDARVGTALTRGREALGIAAGGSGQVPEDWQAALDRAVAALDGLRPADKQRVVHALVQTMLADGDLTVVECELFRALCALLHVPVPMIPVGLAPVVEDEAQARPADKPAAKSQAQVDAPAVMTRRLELPTISIVTPSFNQGDYLEECIDSILSQGYPRLEYVVMDGGSTDQSVSVIKKHEKHLAHWQSQPDDGQYAAIEAGFGHTRGEIMGWLNSDDKHHPESLFKLAFVFLSNRGTHWVTGRHSFWDEHGRFVGTSKRLHLWTPRLLAQRFLNGVVCPQQESTFWRRSLWDAAGARIDTSLKFAGDFELWCRFSQHADLYSYDGVFAGFRRQPNQKTAQHLDRYKAEGEAVVRRYSQHFEASTKEPSMATLVRIPQSDMRRFLAEYARAPAATAEPPTKDDADSAASAEPPAKAAVGGDGAQAAPAAVPVPRANPGNKRVVVCYGMPKSASSFVWQVTTGLLSDDREQNKLRLDMPPGFQDRFVSDDLDGWLQVIEDHLPENAVYVIKTHAALSEGVLERARAGILQCVMSIRDPYDIAASLVDVGAKERAKPADKQRPFFARIRSAEDTVPLVRRMMDQAEPWLAFCSEHGFPIIRFPQVETSPLEVAEEIAEALDADADCAEVVEPLVQRKKEKVLEFNKGVSGRGRPLFEDYARPADLQPFDEFIQAYLSEPG